MEQSFLTLAEVAERLGVCLKTARRLAHEGRLPVVRVGARLRVAPDQFAAWAAAGGTTAQGMQPVSAQPSKAQRGACVQTDRFAINCMTCGTRPDVAHCPRTSEIAFYCGECCPVCSTAFHEGGMCGTARRQKENKINAKCL